MRGWSWSRRGWTARRRSSRRAGAACYTQFGSFDRYVWPFVGGRPQIARLRTLADHPATSPASVALSGDLHRRGFAFVGPTIVYAHMQAAGLVNDHTLDCFRRAEILAKGDGP